jgi:hypothetical protein
MTFRHAISSPELSAELPQAVGVLEGYGWHDYWIRDHWHTNSPDGC